MDLDAVAIASGDAVARGAGDDFDGEDGGGFRGQVGVGSGVDFGFGVDLAAAAVEPVEREVALLGGAHEGAEETG